jgi:hypothetical protein
VRDDIFCDLDDTMIRRSSALSHENECVIRGAVGLDAYQPLCLHHPREELPVIGQCSVWRITHF